jgi:DNA-directed DNA polymerase III PolC
MPVIPLHLHSYYSLLEGVPSIPDIVSFAQAANLPALALTDSNALYGAMEFVSVCRQAGIAPLVGATLNFTGESSLTFVTQNMQGYGNLCQLITRLQATPHREDALARGLALTDLAGHTDGLIALSGGWHGPLDAHLRRGDLVQAESLAHALVNLFGRDHFLVELQMIEAGDAARVAALQTLAERLHLRTVATHDIRYLEPGDAPRYRVLTAMRKNTRLADVPPLPDLSFPSEVDMRGKFADFPAALEATQAIAEECRWEFPLGQWRFPSLEISSGRTPIEEMRSLAFAGAAQRYAERNPAMEARLLKEITVIDQLGYAPYFLVVADIVRFAREQGVPLSPRGSASSSVVAYCLGIHDIDPLAHNLYFERFLSLERHDPPDIDLDLCSQRRAEVIRYVYQKYGADRVAMVCTHTTLRARYALREVGKVYGLGAKRLGELADQLPGFWHPGIRKQLIAAQADLIAQTRDPLEHAVLEMSQALDGAPHHLSIHPGGIVIAPGAITDLVPLQHATKGLLVTQFDLGGIEKAGLIKIDLLGISALTVIAESVELIRQREPSFALEQIPPADTATARALLTGRSIACFQVESPGMRMTLRELAARNTNDLLVALALYRPGPLKGGLKDAFVQRHQGHAPAEYLHPALEPILRETYGVILYQEQVLRIAHEVAGFSLGEADTLRRAMSKKLLREMEQLHPRFISGAQATSGMEATLAQQIWDLMVVFAGYGFPKAHAAGYAVVAYRMAYLKTHYPAEFMTARLAVWGGFYRPGVYMSEARRLGLVVKPPQINHSNAVFTLEPPRTLWMGLGQVRELTRVTMQNILSQRPFDSLADFLRRAQPQYVEAVNLVKAGALEGLGNRKTLLAQLERERWTGRHTAQLGLLPSPSAFAETEPTLHECAIWENEVLGQFVSVHPLQLVTKATSGYNLMGSAELEQQVGQEVTLGGIRLATHRFALRNEPRWLVDMEDEQGMYQVLWGGARLNQNRALLSQRDPVLIRGRVQTDRQGQVIVAGLDIRRLPPA